MQDKNLDDRDLPTSEGVYLIKNPNLGGVMYEVEVYKHPVKGFCCFSDELVQDTGLEFITKTKELNKNALGRKIQAEKP